VLIAKTQEFFGVNKSREIYERAVEALPEGAGLIKMCMKYARTEAALGEVDRARAVFQHCSQFCDPRKEVEFWSKWRFFEVQHGNEDTFRDMLRIKRSMDAQYAQKHFNTENIHKAKIERQKLDPMAAAEQEMDKAAMVKEEEMDDPLDFEAQLKKLGTTDREARSNFEPAESFQGSRIGYVFKMGVQGLGYYEDNEAYAKKPGKAAASGTAMKKGGILSNPEEIDIGMDLEELDVPSGVFGGLAETAANLVPPEAPGPDTSAPVASSEEPTKKRAPKLGALAKFKKPRKD